MERIRVEVKRILINNNAYNIKLTANCDPEIIQFLDLELYKSGNQLFTRTYFKEVDRNGYVSTRSCHHPRQLRAIPKGQFIKINYDRNDYFLQSDKIIERFFEKGYKKAKLLKIRDVIGQLERNYLLVKKPNREKQGDIAFITGFHTQYKNVEKNCT